MRLERLKPQGPGPDRVPDRPVQRKCSTTLGPEISEEKKMRFSKKFDKHLTIPGTMRSKNFRDVDPCQGSTVHREAHSRFQASWPRGTMIRPCWRHLFSLAFNVHWHSGDSWKHLFSACNRHTTNVLDDDDDDDGDEVVVMTYSTCASAGQRDVLQRGVWRCGKIRHPVPRRRVGTLGDLQPNDQLLPRRNRRQTPLLWETAGPVRMVDGPPCRTPTGMCHEILIFFITMRRVVGSRQAVVEVQKYGTKQNNLTR